MAGFQRLEQGDHCLDRVYVSLFVCERGGAGRLAMVDDRPLILPRQEQERSNTRRGPSQSSPSPSTTMWVWIPSRGRPGQTRVRPPGVWACQTYRIRLPA